MIADSEILTYIFLGFVAFLFVMIFWNVLGGPRKPRSKRWGRGGAGVAGNGGETMVGRGDRHSGGDDGGSDGGGGDGGGGD